MTYLLDASVLICLCHVEHSLYERCVSWFSCGELKHFSTTPFTQTALLRISLQIKPDLKIEGALAILEALCADQRHEFWSDELGFSAIRWQGVIGHRQITDARLAALARAHGGRLATLDKGLAALHPDVAELIPA